MIELLRTHRRHQIYVDKRNMLIAPALATHGAWEPHVEAAITRLLKPGQIAVEIGANFGYHTLGMAEAVGPTGHVFAFEANPELTPLVTRSIEANGFKDRVTLSQVAVSDYWGALFFHYAPAANGGGQVAVGPLGENEKRISIICVKLDDVFVTLPKIDFLRMDIEGSELPALRGAFDLICRSPDLVIVTEWAPPKMAHFGSVHDLVDRLTLYGFHMWLIDCNSGELKQEQMRTLLGVHQAPVVLCRQDSL